MNAPRGKPADEAPTVWAAAEALKRITTKARRKLVTRSVYLALCEVASLARNPTFRRPVRRIAGQAGTGYRATFDAIKDLRRLGLIRFPAIKANDPTRNEGLEITLLGLGESKCHGGTLEASKGVGVMHHVHNGSASGAGRVMHHVQTEKQSTGLKQRPALHLRSAVRLKALEAARGN